jgi:SAM-dependent methyltransferase
MYEIETDHWWFRSLHELVIHNLTKHPNCIPSILDAGCGTGRLMTQIQNMGKISGFDFRDTALAYCRKRNLKNVRKVDLNSWVPIENQFDFIISLDVISDEGILNDKLIIHKFYKALKPGGKLIIHVPAIPLLKRSHDLGATIKKRYLKKEIIELAKCTGFTPLIVKYRLFFAFPIFLVIKFLDSFSLKKEIPKTDMYKLPSNANSFFLRLGRFENMLIMRGVSPPWGTSLFSILQKS